MGSFGKMINGYEGYDPSQMLVGAHYTWKLMAIDWTNREKTRKGLEELFLNMTLSMLATPSLTYVHHCLPLRGL